jgi:hypothetical protein
MTKFDWPTFLRRLEFRGGLSVGGLRCRVESTPGDWINGDPAHLTVCLRVPDIHTGKTIEVFHRSEIPPYIADDREAFRFVRLVIRRALEHEPDESLLLDGAMVRDPHAHERTMAGG